MPRLARVAAVVTAAAALSVLASGPATAGGPTLSDPRVIAHFDAAAGQNAENIALEPDGSADLTFAFARQVARVDPRGTTTVLATLPPVAAPNNPLVTAAVVTGIVRADDGTLYVNYATGTRENGIWRIDPGGGAPTRIAHLPANGFPNGLALDEECGTLYAADSVLGTVWSVPRSGGTPTAWATGTALRRASGPEGFIGANGVKVHQGAVWVSNTDRGTLLRIPVRPDKSAGPIETRSSGLVSIDDFAFTGHGDTVLAALIQRQEVALVRPDGTHTTVLTEHDGLSAPTSVAVRGRSVYVTSAAYFDTEHPDPHLLLARLGRNKG